MEEACHELDLASADPSCLSAMHNEGGISFSRYSDDLHSLSRLKDDAEKCRHTITVLDQLSTFCSLTLPESDHRVEQVRKETLEQRRKLHEMV